MVLYFYVILCELCNYRQDVPMFTENGYRMMKKGKSRLSTLLLGLALCVPAVAQRGYYKDIFMDGGISVSSRTTLPSATVLNLTMDYLTCSSHKLDGKSAYNAADSIFQLELLGGNAMDENGILLYPDGQPRFRMIFMNGGGAARHGASLGEAGRQNIRTFVRNGGSYVGSCAGAFLSSAGALGKDGQIHHTDCYLGIWPGHTLSTALSDSRTGLTLDAKSPLLKYDDFGGDHRVDSVYHNNGCYALTDSAWPKETEVLLRYDTEGGELKRDINKQAGIWAYKANGYAGRVIACGSHPEGNSSGERLDLMCAMVRYALDGNGSPRLKGELKNGEPRKMTCRTSDQNPDYTRIGDRQYHYFVVDVPKGSREVVLSLEPVLGYSDYAMYLCAGYDPFPKMENAGYRNVSSTFAKEIRIPNPKHGKLYVSVFCNTTVDTVDSPYGHQYAGRVDVLNGVPYIIKAAF